MTREIQRVYHIIEVNSISSCPGPAQLLDGFHPNPNAAQVPWRATNLRSPRRWTPQGVRPLERAKIHHRNGMVMDGHHQAFGVVWICLNPPWNLGDICDFPIHWIIFPVLSQYQNSKWFSIAMRSKPSKRLQHRGRWTPARPHRHANIGILDQKVTYMDIYIYVLYICIYVFYIIHYIIL